MLPIKGGAQPVRGRGLQKLADEHLFAGKQGSTFTRPQPHGRQPLESVGLLMVICSTWKNSNRTDFYSWEASLQVAKCGLSSRFSGAELAPDVCEHQYRILFCLKWKPCAA